ncbi:hypothetical protein [Fundidesulfovibrio agrisoli]|uniref:hypothetical protein n=1 Tax=Fundidesulfovibrio agrisoli TaxID=2922717 RepID=UPI001FAE3495|nr:hypothetical protein [Fundidesulfovibrio agrisoli]
MLPETALRPGLAARTITLWLALCALPPLLGLPPAFAQGDDAGDRPASTFSTSDQMRIGQDDQGDSVMSIPRKAPAQDQTPQVGPIYVYPQVNTQPYGYLPPGQQQPRPTPNPAPRGRPQ